MLVRVSYQVVFGQILSDPCVSTHLLLQLYSRRAVQLLQVPKPKLSEIFVSIVFAFDVCHIVEVFN